MKPIKWIWVLLIIFGCQAQPQPIPPDTLTPSSSPSSAPTVIPFPSETPFIATPVEIVAGTGEAGSQDGPAMQASFGDLSNLCHDPNNGKLYILDRNVVRVLNTDGNVKTLAGTTEPGYQDGTGTAAHFNFMADCVVDSQGQVLIVDQGNRRIRKMTPEGQVTTLAGNGDRKTLDGPLLSASFRWPESLALADNGELYVSDGFYIRHIKDGRIDTLNAHQTTATSESFYLDGDIGTQATFSDQLNFAPRALDTGLYIADGNAEVIRHMDANSQVVTISKRSEPGPSNPNGFHIPLDITYSAKLNSLVILDAIGLKLIQAHQNEVKELKPSRSRNGPRAISLHNDNQIYFIVPEAHQIQRLTITDELLAKAEVVSR